jgi:hypothetical protein
VHLGVGDQYLNRREATVPNTTKSISVNPGAKAVLPTAKTLDRSEILAQLGLNPHTSPDAWLALIMCGANASALHPGDAQQLIDKGVLTAGHADLGPALAGLRAKGGQ